MMSKIQRVQSIRQLEPLTPDSVYEWLISPYYVIAEKDTYNEIAYGFSSDTYPLNDVDVYSLGELSTGVYKADVDSYSWDFTNMTFGSISQFKI